MDENRSFFIICAASFNIYIFSVCLCIYWCTFLEVIFNNVKVLLLYRRERDGIEAERAHHIKQIHDLQEHLQDKEGQLLELQEQVC